MTNTKTSDDTLMNKIVKELEERLSEPNKTVDVFGIKMRNIREECRLHMFRNGNNKYSFNILLGDKPFWYKNDHHHGIEKPIYLYWSDTVQELLTKIKVAVMTMEVNFSPTARMVSKSDIELGKKIHQFLEQETEDKCYICLNSNYNFKTPCKHPICFDCAVMESEKEKFKCGVCRRTFKEYESESECDD
jgi:hypothetical protein